MYRANGQSYRNVAHYEFHELLCAEAQKRKDRPPGEWPRMEEQMMFDEVNRRRGLQGKSPVSFDEFQKRHQLAIGHFDYGTKFALYCSEMVEEA